MVTHGAERWMIAIVSRRIPFREGRLGWAVYQARVLANPCLRFLERIGFAKPEFTNL
jgi:hypothetical protein